MKSCIGKDVGRSEHYSQLQHRAVQRSHVCPPGLSTCEVRSQIVVNALDAFLADQPLFSLQRGQQLMLQRLEASHDEHVTILWAVPALGGLWVFAGALGTWGGFEGA